MSEKTQTIDYYNANFEDFISGTLNLDFSSTQDRFLSLLPAGAKILDFGCGSGRDRNRSWVDEKSRFRVPLIKSSKFAL